MIRIVLHILLPLLLPIVLWLAWVAIARRLPPSAGLRRAPWPWLAASGLLLLSASFAVWALLGGAPPGAEYTPARAEEGRIVPGRIDPQ